eukprot:1057027-Prymnesium_polylepis.1
MPDDVRLSGRVFCVSDLVNCAVDRLSVALERRAALPARSHIGHRKMSALYTISLDFFVAPQKRFVTPKNPQGIEESQFRKKEHL